MSEETGRTDRTASDEEPVVDKPTRTQQVRAAGTAVLSAARTDRGKRLTKVGGALVGLVAVVVLGRKVVRRRRG
ncbi:MAG TPA: hypothetical protein VL481_03045 [Verrucomicrobiae bacterium]|nr:hypothetical protein [Verrucomicrobiae bacterium]